ncbi:MAG: hypothetical protein LBJ89_03210 [Holosporales bacterium]|jgi:hypothetical protein|nr:hypothetical protein [Holosporales bacterium]
MMEAKMTVEDTLETITGINDVPSKTAMMGNTGTVSHDTLDHFLLQTVHEHPFSVSGGALIIGITILKIIKKLRGK